VHIDWGFKVPATYTPGGQSQVTVKGWRPSGSPSPVAP
jgi:hypothetical protein